MIAATIIQPTLLGREFTGQIKKSQSKYLIISQSGSFEMYETINLLTYNVHGSLDHLTEKVERPHKSKLFSSTFHFNMSVLRKRY